MAESVLQGAVKEALKTLLGGAGTALGYDFVSNPQGFILAVFWTELVGIAQNVANETAARAFGVWALFTSAVVDPLAFALGSPGRLLADVTYRLLDLIDTMGVAVAAALGPFGFLAVPIVWGVAIVVAVSAIVGIWRLYKWIRVVVA